MFQCFRVGQGFTVPYRLAVHHIANGQFDDLATLGPGNIRNLQYTRRYMSGRSIRPDLKLDPVDQIIIELKGCLLYTSPSPRDS